jgi:hypothetical protein
MSRTTTISCISQELASYWASELWYLNRKVDGIMDWMGKPFAVIEIPGRTLAQVGRWKTWNYGL